MSEVRALIQQLVDAGLEPIEAAEIVTRAAIAGAKESVRSAGAIRQERYRRNKASQTVTSDAEVTPPKESSPTPPKEKQPPTKENTPLRGVQKKASRLPETWVLPDEWRADALAAGLPEPLADLEAAKMLDWSRSSRNGAKLDWRAVWRNWCREAAARLPRARGSPQQQAPSMSQILEVIRDQASADEPEHPEDRSSLRAAIPHLRAVGAG